jgi:hypothetical protein
MKTTIGRIILTVVLLVLVWMDNKIALYITVSLAALGSELQAVLIKNIYKKIS